MDETKIFNLATKSYVDKELFAESIKPDRTNPNVSKDPSNKG